MSKGTQRWGASIIVLMQVLAFQNCSRFDGSPSSTDSSGSALEFSSLQASEDLLPDPGFSSPRLKVHAGKIENFMPKIETPHMALDSYEVSGWALSQWRKQAYIMPTDIKAGDEVDPLLGKALYSMKSTSRESEIKMFKHPSNKGFVFELTGRQGWLAQGGGSNVFLSADVRADRKNTFDGKISLSLESKLLTSKGIESVAGASRDGSVVGQYFSGFTVSYEDPSGRLPRTGLFIQIHHADTRGPMGGEYRGCYPHNGYQEIVYSHTIKGDHFFLTTSDPKEALTRKQFDVNRYLCEALAKDFSCVDEAGKRTIRSFKEYGSNLSLWKVGSYYTGLETQAAFGSATVPSEARGETEMKVQLADIRLVRDSSKTFVSCDDYFAGRAQGALAPTNPSQPVNPGPTPSVGSSCGKGTFKSGNQMAEYSCGCGTPEGEGWVPQSNNCFHRLLKDSFFCASGNKTYFRCKSGHPGVGWVDVGSGCYHLGTDESCN